jgi:hypothetical protein
VTGTSGEVEAVADNMYGVQVGVHDTACSCAQHSGAKGCVHILGRFWPSAAIMHAP